MVAVDFVAVPNKSSHLTFEDLRLRRSRQEVLCRLLRLWESKNIKRDNKFMGITLLFLDEKKSLGSFLLLLRQSLIFKINFFDVGHCIEMYKIIDSPFVIIFMDDTVIAPVEPTISMEHEIHAQEAS